MINSIKDKDLLESMGVYQILNTHTQVRYIGSTTQSFRKRCYQHRTELTTIKHKNPHLQRSYAKHGASNFVFSIVKICNTAEECRNYEQQLFDTVDFKMLYNINTNAHTPTDPVVIKRRNQSIRDATKLRMEKYEAWKFNGFKDVEFEENDIKWFKTLYTPWNKGKVLSEEHKSKLRDVTRVMTSPGKKSRNNAMRRNAPCIEVYRDDTLIATFRSAIDLQDLSMKDDFPLVDYMTLINKKGRNGYPSGRMCRIRVTKVMNTNVLYKGLAFKSVNAPYISNGVSGPDEFMEALYNI